MENNVQSYYDANTQLEWERLGIRHRTEFAVTMRALGEFLPSPPAKLIDIGGGPGRYSIALAKMEYNVTLADLSEGNLAFAKAKAGEMQVELDGFVQANALDLSRFASGYFDAVLLMGPLYHLWDVEERRQALREARRLLKPGGVIFATFISRFAAFRDAIARGLTWVFDEPDETEKLLSTGINIAEDDGFTDAYFAHPDEVIPLCESAGFTTILRMGCQGVAAGHEDYINSRQGQEFETWNDINYRISKDPAAIGASDHILYIGKKIN